MIYPVSCSDERSIKLIKDRVILVQSGQNERERRGNKRGEISVGEKTIMADGFFPFNRFRLGSIWIPGA